MILAGIDAGLPRRIDGAAGNRLHRDGRGGLALAAGALTAVACLTKPQAIFVLPVSRSRCGMGVERARGVVRRGGKAAAVSGAALLLTSRQARLGISCRASARCSARHAVRGRRQLHGGWSPTLCAPSYAAGELGAWAAWTMTLRILGMSGDRRSGIRIPRPIAFIAVDRRRTAWASGARAVPPDLALLAAACAFIVHAYFLLGVAVHENHLYLAVPLLALAAAAPPRFRPDACSASVVFALNLYLFVGLGRGFRYRIEISRCRLDGDCWRSSTAACSPGTLAGSARSAGWARARPGATQL